MFRVIIPSRYQATRLPAKLLMDIQGKSMLQRVYEQARLSDAAEVMIAADDERIVSHARDFNANVVMTAIHHQSGTERIAELVEKLELADDAIVVNVQGDLPLISPQAINQVASYLVDQPSLPMATLCQPIWRWEDVQNPHVVKVIFDAHQHAIYFSRQPIPWSRTMMKQVYYKHIGLYAYRVGFIKQYVAWPACKLETLESLEQLRALWYGAKIWVGISETADSPTVDTQEDLDKVRELVRITLS